MTYLSVFLGNPGAQYARTRHNVARRVLERVEPELMPSWQQKFKGRFAKLRMQGVARAEDTQVILLVPETFMNKSGESVQPCADFFRIPSERILVVHDDTELDFGAVALKFGGGLGGNNGLKSLTDRLGTRDFHRLRIGISRPRRGDLSSHVLGAFSDEEESALGDVLDTARKRWREFVAGELTKR